MKKVIFLLVIASSFAVTSCQKCYDCTFVEEDGTVTEDVLCNNPSSVKIELEQRELNGWDCVKQ